MNANLTIYGYVVDAGAYHVGCTTARPGPDRDDVTAIFSYMADGEPEGLTCDACHDYIFEPTGTEDDQPATEDFPPMDAATFESIWGD